MSSSQKQLLKRSADIEYARSQAALLTNMLSSGNGGGWTNMEANLLNVSQSMQHRLDFERQGSGGGGVQSEKDANFMKWQAVFEGGADEPYSDSGSESESESGPSAPPSMRKSRRRNPPPPTTIPAPIPTQLAENEYNTTATSSAAAAAAAPAVSSTTAGGNDGDSMNARMRALQSRLDAEIVKSGRLMAQLDDASSADPGATPHGGSEKMGRMLNDVRCELEAKQAALVALTARVADEERRRNEMESMYRELQQEKIASEAQFVASIAALEQEKTDLEAAVNTHITESRALRDEIADKEKELSARDDRLKANERERVYLEEERARHEDEAVSVKTQMMNHKRDNEGLRTDNIIMTEKINILEREKEAFLLAHESLNRAADSNNSGFEVKLKAILQRINEAHSRQEEASVAAERQKLQHQIQRALEKHQTVERQAERELGALRRELVMKDDELKDRVASFKVQIEDVFGQKRALEARLQAVQQQVHSQRQTSFVAGDELDTLHANVERLSTEIGELRLAKQSSQRQVAAVTRENSDLRSSMARVEEEKQAALHKSEELQEALRLLARSQTRFSNGEVTGMQGAMDDDDHHHRYGGGEGTKQLRPIETPIRVSGVGHYCCSYRADGKRSCDPQCNVQ